LNSPSKTGDKTSNKILHEPLKTTSLFKDENPMQNSSYKYDISKLTHENNVWDKILRN
jgi:hypothetical protein